MKLALLLATTVSLAACQTVPKHVSTESLSVQLEDAKALGLTVDQKLQLIQEASRE